MSLVLFLAAAAASAPPAPLPPARQVAIRRYFDAKLLDGASARWKWPKQQANRKFYCGWVNARNRLGAYTGWTAYTVLFDGAQVSSSVMLNDPKDVMTETFTEVCTRQGYDVLNPPLD